MPASRLVNAVLHEDGDGAMAITMAMMVIYKKVVTMKMELRVTTFNGADDTRRHHHDDDADAV